uniref:Uncharacterized protein n=1 Tax=Candidatus Kentrum sp. FM TaxID=2126340 RepID=A0A450TX85_9GAMM|nr:MAG: hypothetical protein BECKFM1743A_GA0114220_107371 [Candidatus Kentron sp. FM]
MTTLYAWNTARAGSVAISECTRGAPIPPYKGPPILWPVFDTSLPPTKKYARSVITTKGMARKTANRLVSLPALAIDIAIRYRYRSYPAFSIASSDIDSDPERTTITRCGLATL